MRKKATNAGASASRGWAPGPRGTVLTNSLTGTSFRSLRLRSILGGLAGEKPNRAKEDFSLLGPLSQVTLRNPVALPRAAGGGFLSSVYRRRNW